MKLRVRLWREGKEEWRAYEIDVRPNATLLDALLTIRRHFDPSLAFRCVCRMGICGACLVTANGIVRLACTTRIDELGNTIIVEPVRGKRVIRDLITED